MHDNELIHYEAGFCVCRDCVTDILNDSNAYRAFRKAMRTARAEFVGMDMERVH
ncbi:hypothetical protein [Methylohalobius crimeensis]|uniref:hypothetical protein n=1 Tax=Methylohalobius crimeensis TaxID=244365 RepID=UPI0003B78450|nr:hypothetical protein [Methylohalobius crimeensis]